MAAMTGFDFHGHGAVITGGTRGIGAAIVQALKECGAAVHVFDLTSGEEAGVGYQQVDIRKPDQIASALAEIATPITLLVNNAGITRDRTILKMSGEEWRDVIDVNLTGAFNMMQAVAPGMIEAGHGRIVNLTSINGLRGKFGQANYSASKAGLIGLTKTAAREFGKKGITVNAIAPGMVLTEMALAAPREIRDTALAESALGKLAQPGDIAQAVLFLLSDAARMITGEVLRVDAGQYL
jgi:acetoacetyl-CoA reductase/3-oxoacyl-[acyl-carrier protein] reductase